MNRVLAQDGSVMGAEPDLTDAERVTLYELMVMSRVFDRGAFSLQRQGRIGTYPMLEGHEAAQIGSAMALDEPDWVFPGYREHGSLIARGMPMDVILSYWKGLPNDEWNPHKFRVMCLTVPIATHLPHAVGFGYAAQLQESDLVTLAYLGDGGTSESDFHSALTFAGVWKTPTVFFCQNNGYAISVPLHMQTAAERLADKAIGYGMPGVQVDGMDVLAVYAATKEAVARARSGDGPSFIEAVCYRYGAHATADDARRYRRQEEEEEWRLRDPIDRYRAYLEARGLWSADLERSLVSDAEARFRDAVAAMEAKPVPGRHSAVRHVYARIPQQLVDQLHVLERGAGEPPTRFEDGDRWIIEEEREPAGPTEVMTMAEAIRFGLGEALDRHAEAVVLGEDVGITGGVFRITDGLLEAYGSQRVIDTPLNESGIVGTAVGMAVAGARPIAEIQFDGFVYPAFDQIVSHVARLRFRSRGHVTLPIVIRWPNGGGIAAHEFHCDSPEAYFAHAPGLVVVAPSTAVDAKGLLAAAVDSNDPVLFLEPKVLYRSVKEPVPTDHYTVPIGRARIRRPGSDLTLVTYGGLVPVALRAAEQSPVETEVVDLRTLYPWDVETVLDSLRRTGRLLIVQEPPQTAGIAAEIAAYVAEHAGYDLVAPVKRLTGLDAPWPQFHVERHALITDSHITRAIADTVAG